VQSLSCALPSPRRRGTPILWHAHTNLFGVCVGRIHPYEGTHMCVIVLFDGTLMRTTHLYECTYVCTYIRVPLRKGIG
jgi:hypothetical protein